MTNSSIYIQNVGRTKIQKHYDHFLASLPLQTESKYVSTSFGMTHILVAGPKEGKPLFILQGGNCINPMSLAWFLPLAEHYRIYAPDNLGHPGYSDENRISPKDASFARWIEELMDYFDVAKSAFIGPSYGAGVILGLAAYLPHKIACVALVSPAGIATGSIPKMMKEIVIPLIRFKATGNRSNVEKIIQHMSEQRLSDMEHEILYDVFTYVALEREMPRKMRQKDLKDFAAPTMIIAGEDDIFFPAQKLLTPAFKRISNLVLFKTYSMGHFPNQEFLPFIQQDIANFFTKHYE